MDQKQTNADEMTVISRQLAHHAADLLRKVGDKQAILPREAAKAAKQLANAADGGRVLVQVIVGEDD